MELKNSVELSFLQLFHVIGESKGLLDRESGDASCGMVEVVASTSLRGCIKISAVLEL